MTPCPKCGRALEREGAPCPACVSDPFAATLNGDTSAAVGAATPALGKIGRYELLSVAGQGGMGTVYRARDAALGRVVALKVMIAGEHASAETLRRFQREARAAAKLTHPGIVRVYDVGSEGGRDFIAMEFVEGKSLDEATPEPREAARIVREVARALEYAHERGVVHRDIKPANVMVDAAGTPRLTDFGLAKATGEEGTLTSAGQIMGTACYMPPEQATGMADVDHRSDVYSLGVVLYELLAARRPFQGPTLAAILRLVEEQEPPPPSAYGRRVPRDLETICLKAMAKEKSRRYDDARAFAEDLDRFLEGKPIAARRTGAAERILRLVKRHPVAATASVIAAVFAGALVWSLFRPGKAPGPDPMAQFQKAKPLFDDALADFDQARRVRASGDRKRRGELFTAAASKLDRAIEEFPGYADAHYLRAQVRTLQNRRPTARQDLDRAIALDPNLVEARYGRAWLKLQDFDERFTRVEDFLDLPEFILMNPQDKATVVADIGEMKRLKVRPEKALTLEAFMRLTFHDGEALPVVEEALRANPTFADALWLRGYLRLLGRRGRSDDEARQASLLAEADATAAIAVEPNHREAYALRAHARYFLGLRPEAMEDADQIVEITPDEAQSYVERASLLFKIQLTSTPRELQGRIEADINRALELDPRHPQAHYMRAQFHLLAAFRMVEGYKMADAEAKFRALAASDPDYTTGTAYLLAFDLARTGDQEAFTRGSNALADRFPVLSAARRLEFLEELKSRAVLLGTLTARQGTREIVNHGLVHLFQGRLEDADRVFLEARARLEDPAIQASENISNTELRAMTGMVAYRRACVLARLRRGDEAFAELEGAFAAHFPEALGFEEEPDLESLHTHASWKAFVELHGRRDR